VPDGSATNPAIDNKALVNEYKQEIKDLWDTYAARETRKQSMVGVVTSTKCAKSITVTVTRQKLVPKYRKLVNTRKKFMAHDEEERANVGDLVRIVPCRPMSRKKRHRLMDIIKECGQLDFSSANTAAAPLATNSSSVSNA
jgi:small subunit ribosomal protein S17